MSKMTLERWAPTPLVCAAAAAGIAMAALAGCSGGAPANINAVPAAPGATAASGLPTAGVNPAATPPVSNYHYVNSQAFFGENPTLARYFVPFSFDYPATWRTDPTAGRTPTSELFVRLKHFDASGKWVEEVDVAPTPSTGDAMADQQRLPQVMQALDAQFATVPGYRRIDEGQTTFGGSQALQLRYSLTDQAGRTIFCRSIELLGFAGTNGVRVDICAASPGSAVQSIDDLGVKGDLPIIVNSFKLGT